MWYSMLDGPGEQTMARPAQVRGVLGVQAGLG